MFNLSFFMAKRLYKDKHAHQPVSGLAVNLATWGVGVGLAVMLITICIVLGFKHEIKHKITGYGADIQIMYARTENSPENCAIYASDSVCKEIKRTPGIKSLQRTSTKFGIVKTNNDYKEIIFKGLEPNYDVTYLQEALVEGKLPVLNQGAKQEVLISKSISNRMNLHVGDKIYAYFLENTMKVRRYQIVGIYNTDMQQFDDNIIFTNIKTINQLNGWNDKQCSTIEVRVNNWQELDDTYYNLLGTLKNLQSAKGEEYIPYTIQQLYVQMFDWLNLLDLNIWVILALMTLLACLTMISGLLILILEKTSTIGILKAMGARGKTIRNIFMWYAFIIIGRGMLLGYGIGIGLSALQYHFHFFTLGADKYYVSYVPILFNWPILIGVGVATLIICLLALIGPSFLVSTIRPAKAIKFE